MDFRFLQRRLRNIGISRDHSRLIARYFNFQVEMQGYTGAVTFFKRVGSAIINGIDPNTQKATWVATAFRYPKRLAFLRNYPVDVQFKVAKIARAIRYPKIHEAQSKKVLDGVTKPYQGTSDGIDLLTSVMLLGLEGLSIPEFAVKSMPQIGRQFNRVQSVSGRVPVTMEPPIKESLDLIGNTVFEQLPGISEAFLPLYVERLYNLPEDHPGELPVVVGEIHAAQEGGGKLRMFASPYTIFQIALTPLHEWLAGFRKQLLTDCTYDQDEGALWAQSRLKSGRKVAAADLSTATCRFPLDSQIAILRALGVPDIWIDCLIAVCRGLWIVGDDLLESGYFPDYLKWEVGQPLGIRPSMSMFSTCHNLVLRGLCRFKGLNPDESFRILGDDVVMDDELFGLYTTLMTVAGVPISWDKSHVSNVYSEFAGYSIHADAIVRPGQWRKADTSNFIELAKWAEVPLTGEVDPELEKIQKLILFQSGKFIPEPVDYSKFLRASTLLLMRGIDQPDWIRTTTTWFSGFKAVCERQLGEHVRFFPYVRSAITCMDVLKDLPTYAENYWRVSESEWYGINTVLDFGIQTIYESLENGSLNWESGALRLKQLLAECNAYLWLPPLITKEDKLTAGRISELLTVMSSEDDLNWRVVRLPAEIAL